jgi:hypothetical protein
MKVISASIPSLSTEWPALLHERIASVEDFTSILQPYDAVILSSLALLDIKSILSRSEWSSLTHDLSIQGKYLQAYHPGFPIVRGLFPQIPMKITPVLNLELTRSLQFVNGDVSKLYHKYKLHLHEDIVSIAEYCLGSNKRILILQAIVASVLNLRILTFMILEAKRVKKESVKWKARSTVLANSIVADLSPEVTKKVFKFIS